MGIHKKRALVFEPNPYHFTLLPSYIFYLNKLGYSTTLLVHDSFSPDQELYSFPSSKGALDCDVRFFHDVSLSDVSVKTFDPFDLVWVTSMITSATSGGWTDLFSSIGGYPNPRDGLYGTIHDVRFDETKFDKSHFTRLFCLFPSNNNRNYGYPSISLSYYGNIYERSLSAHPRRHVTPVLTSIGVSISLRGILKPIAKAKKSVELNLIGARAHKAFFRDALIKQIGSIFFRHRGDYWKNMLPLNPVRFHELKKRVQLLGKLESSQMYSCLSKTDFLVADFEGEDLEIFSKQRVSGIALLSLGFAIPMIVNQTIAQSWGFSDDVAIIFPDGKFEQGLKQALMINEEQYSQMQNALQEKAYMEQQSSLDEIARCIDKMGAK